MARGRAPGEHGRAVGPLAPAGRRPHDGMAIEWLTLKGRELVYRFESGKTKFNCRYRPIMVVDGKEITWEDFGRLLTGYEGWQFKFDIRDPSEEV